MILAVQPVGQVDDQALREVAACAEAQFGFDAYIEPPLPEPKYAWDARRGQYSSFEVLRTLAALPVDVPRLIGVTECDLFIPALTFVFGQAQVDGKIALVSLARLRQEFYGLRADDEVFRTRLRKETMHELGHTLGLIHCGESFCTMRLSTGILQVDVKEDRLCDACRNAALERVARGRQERNEVAMEDPRR